MLTSQTTINPRSRPPIPPTPLYQAALVFAATSLLFFGCLYLLLPLLRRHNISWFASFNLALAAPMFLLVGCALFAMPWKATNFVSRTFGIASACADGSELLGLDGWPRDLYVWRPLRQLSGILVGHLCVEPRPLAGLATKNSGLPLVSRFSSFSWLIWQTRNLFIRIPLRPLPLTLQEFLAQLSDPKAFMGIPLRGEWWVPTRSRSRWQASRPGDRRVSACRSAKFGPSLPLSR